MKYPGWSRAPSPPRRAGAWALSRRLCPAFSHEQQAGQPQPQCQELLMLDLVPCVLLSNHASSAAPGLDRLIGVFMSRTSGRRDALSCKALCPGAQPCPFLLVFNVWLVYPNHCGESDERAAAACIRAYTRRQFIKKFVMVGGGARSLLASLHQHASRCIWQALHNIQ